ncbi:MAG: hypothetical protein ACHQ52_14855, partial [Candidatus Eisenbacteria bacterium]
MRRPLVILPWLVAPAVAVLLGSSAAPASPAAGPQVTIYSHDLAYVREPRTLTLGGGRDTLRLADVPERVDFSSVGLDAGGRVRVERLAYRYDVASGDGLLENSLGRRVRIVSLHGERTTEGTLVASDGSWLVVRADDGAMLDVSRADVGSVRLADAARGLSLRPTIEVVVESSSR